MRTLVIGDIHGGLLALHQIFERAKICTDDKLIFLGDYADGWSQTPEVIDFLIEIRLTHKARFIRGNHDELLLNYFLHGVKHETWIAHGGEASIAAYANVSEARKQRHIEFLSTLDDYYTDEQNRLFIHAGYTNQRGLKYENYKPMFYWDRTLWETALALDKTLAPHSLYYPKRLTLYKEIYIGHTPVTRIGETVPIQMANVWNIDTGAGFTGPLTAMDIDTKDYYQSQPLNILYPTEKGRN